MKRDMRARHLLIPVLAASCLFAEEKTVPPKDADWERNIEETKTQTMAFPAGGVLRLKHSVGDLNIEAWDNPNVEITTIASGKLEYGHRDRAQARSELDKVTVAAGRHGDELVITTAFPRRGFLSGGAINLEYHICVPRAARLAIDHGVGAVNVDGVAGDIEAKLGEGEIMLHLPEDAQYSIDARTGYGNVNSDFPGERHRGWFGQKAMENLPRPAHELKLRVGYGDIVLLKIRIPKYPAPGAGNANRSGL
jgi:hypothetical protein